MSSSKSNFKYIDNLIHSGVKEIVLESDIILGNSNEKEKYFEGITLDVADIVIDGNGYAIDAKGKTRIFHCTNRNITLKNITLKNGFQYNGGALKIGPNANLILENCKFINNTSKLDGGAIHNKGTVTLKHCEFKNNEGSTGGAIYNKKGNLTIIKSTIDDNRTCKNSGGALYNYFGDIEIIESTLTANKAKRNGGAIANDKGKLKISKSKLNGNTSIGEYGGGAIVTRGGSITIHESTLNENTSNTMTGRGGAIYNIFGANLILENCKFINNTSKLDGGAICNLLYKKGTVTMKHCEFKNNEGSAGGAIYHKYGNLTIIKSTIDDNRTCKNDGGALYTYSGDIEIIESTLTANKAKRNGGAIANDGGKLKISKSKLNGNTSIGEYGGAIANQQGTLDISESTIAENTSINGAIFCSQEKLKLERCNFENNAAENIFDFITFKDLDKLIQSGKKEITLDTNIVYSFEYQDFAYADGIKINDDIVIDGAGHTIDARGHARIFECLDGCITLKNMTLKNANHKNDGGAILNSAKLNLINVKLTGNSSGRDGGAVFNTDELAVDKCELKANSAAHNGGAIASQFGTLDISESTIAENTSIDGAIFCSQEKLKLERCNIENNFDFITFKDLDKLIQSGKREITLDTDIVYSFEGQSAYLDGIKINDDIVIDGAGHTIDARGHARIFECLDGCITLKNMTLKNANHKNDGGAILNSAKLNLINVKLTGNSAGRDGGAILNSAKLNLLNVKLTGNSAGRDGGAILNSAKLNLLNVKLTGNSAGKNGGALLNTDELAVDKCELKANSAADNGGAIFNGGELNVTESQISENTVVNGNGGAIRSIGDVAIVKSSICKNTSKTGGAIHIKSEKLALAECTIEDNEPEDIDG